MHTPTRPLWLPTLSLCDVVSSIPFNLLIFHLTLSTAVVLGSFSPSLFLYYFLGSLTRTRANTSKLEYINWTKHIYNTYTHIIIMNPILYTISIRLHSNTIRTLSSAYQVVSYLLVHHLILSTSSSWSSLHTLLHHKAREYIYVSINVYKENQHVNAITYISINVPCYTAMINRSPYQF